MLATRSGERHSIEEFTFLRDQGEDIGTHGIRIGYQCSRVTSESDEGRIMPPILENRRTRSSRETADELNQSPGLYARASRNSLAKSRSFFHSTCPFYHEDASVRIYFYEILVCYHFARILFNAVNYWN